MTKKLHIDGHLKNRIKLEINGKDIERLNNIFNIFYISNVT